MAAGYANTKNWVRPRTGARIETPAAIASPSRAYSAPAGGRGLKLAMAGVQRGELLFTSVRARGLKHVAVGHRSLLVDIRPLTGARIETANRSSRSRPRSRSPPYGGVD